MLGAHHVRQRAETDANVAAGSKPAVNHLDGGLNDPHGVVGRRDLITDHP